MMAPRIAVLRGVARHGPEQRSNPSHSSLWTTTTCSASRCASMATISVIRADIDETTGRPRMSTPHRQRRYRRFPKYLRDSPNATLAMRLKSRTTALTFQAWKRFDDVARSKSLRLPVLALQMMIRNEEASRPTSLSESLSSTADWRVRLNSLAFKGITEADMQHWVWILAAPDPDERIARFVSNSERPKPLFLLFQLLRRDETFHKGSSLMSIYNYVARHHVRSRTTPPEAVLPFGAVRRTLDPGLNTTPQTFATLLRLLVHHYLRIWPSALPAVARLAAEYVETLPRMAKRGEKQAFGDACHIFNYALVLFQRKSPVSPVFQMRYNWRAQKVLLAMSTTLPRPLIINRAGFRAIRRVMLALGKSPAERKVALRMARTWPPYRRNWDGRDEQRQPQDDFSRSAQAGVLMREAGYADAEHDRALGVLGGVLPGESPTVQTRSLSPRTWTGAQSSLNVFSTWASRVKATRDVNEAWHEFKQAPAAVDGSPLRPNIQVYAEMFKKLLAAPIQHHRSSYTSSHSARLDGKELLPGDVKEVFPVNDATLTAFEKQRLRPPSAAMLYEQMLHEGMRPVGDCLSVLVQNAPTLEAAMKYLHDSPIDKQTIHRQRQQQQPPPITIDILRGIPLPNFNAYIYLMCRFQPRLTAEPARLGKQRRTGLVHHAIRLCAHRLPPSIEEGRTYKAPWHTIMRTLAQPKLMVSAENTSDRRFQDTETLALALRVFEQVSRVGGVDVVLFDSFCKVVQKSLRWANLTPAVTMDVSGGVANEDAYKDAPPTQDLAAASSPSTAEQMEADLLRRAQAALVAAFEEMIGLPAYDLGTDADADADAAANDDPPPSHSPSFTAAHHPSTPHNITAGAIQGYLQTLGYLGDTDAMMRAMRWVLRTWDDLSVLEDAKDPDDGQHATMGRVFVLFRAFVEGAGEASWQMAWLENQLKHLHRRGCTWRSPSSADADEYVRWHRQAHNEAFWAQVRPHV
ncbi:hypothetical protein SPBR_06540 [Sporothrix brasiliensis 5110]|uniref:Prefoldin subunit n=1 Tax=Sporothrix brasiliensis 5110 TaxID=1398154 RepID=A0A0C2IVJ0_9PEZI|nr:uncharacterized protein SPBR_06540 [Sporothrix brasiliensis 5110]KIH89017.1 hypothetical protein SPBR_06540 [Sporothrix brasiliensis 5110]